jgi:hypothetical protein
MLYCIKNSVLNVSSASYFLWLSSIPHREHIAQLFLWIRSYVTENTITVQFLRAQLIRQRNAINASFSLRPQLVSDRERSQCSLVSSGSARTSQGTQSMLNCFFDLSWYLTENATNAPFFLRPQLLPHRKRNQCFVVSSDSALRHREHSQSLIVSSVSVHTSQKKQSMMIVSSYSYILQAVSGLTSYP